MARGLAAHLPRRRPGRRQDLRHAQRGLRRRASAAPTSSSATSRPTAGPTPRRSSRDLEVVPRRAVDVPRHRVRGDGPRRGARPRARRSPWSTSWPTPTCPGSRNEKRWQDVEELLDAGIDVITTVNIQHLESLNDVVERITGVKQRETIPDEVVRARRPGRAGRHDARGAAPPHGPRQHLRRREGRRRARPTTSASGNLGALRELALLWVADRVDDALQDYKERPRHRRHLGDARAGRGRRHRRAERRAPDPAGGPHGQPRPRATSRRPRPSRATGWPTRPDELLERAPRSCSRTSAATYHEVVGADVAGRAAPTSPAPRTPPSSCWAPAAGRAGPSCTRGSVINEVAPPRPGASTST